MPTGQKKALELGIRPTEGMLSPLPNIWTGNSGRTSEGLGLNKDKGVRGPHTEEEVGLASQRRSEEACPAPVTPQGGEYEKRSLLRHARVHGEPLRNSHVEYVFSTKTSDFKKNVSSVPVGKGLPNFYSGQLGQLHQHMLILLISKTLCFS